MGDYSWRKCGKLENILSIISNEINYDLIHNISDKKTTELTGLKGNSLELMRMNLVHS